MYALTSPCRKLGAFTIIGLYCATPEVVLKAWPKAGSVAPTPDWAYWNAASCSGVKPAVSCPW